MGFAHFPTTNSILSIAAELRMHSRHVVGVPMDNRTPMTRPDGAPELLHSKEWCDQSRVVGLARQRPESRQTLISKTVLQLNSNDSRDGRLSSPAMDRTELILGECVNRLRAGRLSRHRPVCESRRVPDDRMLWKWIALMRFARFPTINSFLSNAGELRRQ
jgi:hypothetical protein